MKKAIILSAVLALISVVALSAQRRVASTDDKTTYTWACPVDSSVRSCPRGVCPMDTACCTSCPNYRQGNNRRASSYCPRYNRAKGCQGHRGYRRGCRG